MQTAELLNIIQFALASLVMKEIQKWVVTTWDASATMTVPELTHAKTRNVSLSVVQTTNHAVLNQNATELITRQFASVHPVQEETREHSA